MTAVTRLDENAVKLEQIARSYPDSGVNEATLAEYRQYSSEQVLRIMLFGSYNAGKSSLINALVGDIVAKEGETPETSQPNSYSWQNCYLIDTPGVNAPIEHEEVTQAQTDRCELILFVIRAGDQDAQDVYTRMMEMLKSGKHIFIVFNHELDALGLSESLQRLNNLLLQQATRTGVNSKIGDVPVIPVNVKTAKLARSKGSDTLMEHSGLASCVQRFLAWLEQHDHESQYLENLKTLLQRIMVDPLICTLAKCSENTPHQELMQLGQQRDALISTFERVESQIRLATRSEITKNKPAIRNAFTTASSSEEIEARIQKIAEDVAALVSKILEQEIDQSLNHLSISLNTQGVSGDQSDPGIRGAIESAAIEGLRQVGSDNIKSLLLELRRLKIPFFKGRWEKTLGTWAGKAAPVLQLLTAAYEIHSANQKEKKENQLQHNQAVQLHAAIEEVTGAIFTQITDQASEAIRRVRDAGLQQIDAQIDDLTAQANQVDQDLQKVRKIESDTAVLKIFD